MKSYNISVHVKGYILKCKLDTKYRMLCFGLSRAVHLSQ